MIDFLSRMIGAARLNPHIYDDVKRDSGTMIQSLLIVAMLVAIAVAEGVWHSSEPTVEVVALAAIGVLTGWIVWGLLAWAIGSTVLRTTDTNASWLQMVRTTAFAQTPGFLNIFAVFVPALGFSLGLISFIWLVACMVIAIRQTLDYTSNARAFIVLTLSGMVIVIIIAVILVVAALTGNLQFE